jgi:hypothetical protein
LTGGKDFFVSYTGADQAWAEWIAHTLEANGHATVLQAWDFRPGESFIERMNQALGEAERLLAVASPAYFRSPTLAGNGLPRWPARVDSPVGFCWFASRTRLGASRSRDGGRRGGREPR